MRWPVRFVVCLTRSRSALTRFRPMWPRSTQNQVWSSVNNKVCCLTKKCQKIHKKWTKNGIATFADFEIIVISQWIHNVKSPDLYIIRFVLVLAFEWAQKNANPITGHKVMAKKLKANQNIWKYWLFWP